MSILDKLKGRQGAAKRPGTVKRSESSASAEPIKTPIADNTEEPAADRNEMQTARSRENTAPSVLSFYDQCVEDFHRTAAQEGQSENGPVIIPELIPIGEKTVLEFLKDPFFRMEFDSDPQMFHYVIMSLSLQAGIVFGAKWHEDFAALNDAYVDRIIRDGPESECKPYLRQLGLTDRLKESAFYDVIFERWTAMHESVRKMRDPREYTFRATLAAYQLGVSMILGKSGYRTDNVR